MANQPGDKATDAKSNVVPLIFGAVVIAALGYLFLGDLLTGPTRFNSPAVEKTTAKEPHLGRALSPPERASGNERQRD
jgi:hypothetical protein